MRMETLPDEKAQLPLAMSEGTNRLLKLAAAFPIRQPERTRLMKSLQMLYDAEWQRLLVKLEEPSIAALTQRCEAQLLEDCSDLELILNIAATVTHLYEFEVIDVPQIAVSLAVTAGFSVDEIEIVVEAFGIGHLENPEKIFNKYLEFQESGLLNSIFSGDEEAKAIGRRPAKIAHRWAKWINLMIRIAAFFVIAFVGLTSGNPLALLSGAAALVSSRDPRNDWPDSESRVWNYRPALLELRLKFPWLGAIALLSALFVSSSVAWILISEYLVIEAVRVICLRAWTRGIFVANASLLELGQVAANSISLPDRVLERRQGGFLTAAVIGLVACLSIYPSLASIFFVVYLFAVYGNLLMISGSVILLGVLAAHSLPVLLPVLLRVIAGGTFAYVITRSSRRVRFPAAPRDIDFALLGHPHALIRTINARILLRRGKPNSAALLLDVADVGGKLSPGEFLLLSWAWLHAHEIGRAKASLLASGKKASSPFGRLIAFMIETKSTAAAGTAPNSVFFADVSGANFSWWVAVANVERALITASPTEAAAIAKSLIDNFAPNPDVGRLVITLRMASEACIEFSPWNASLLALTCKNILDIAQGNRRMRQFGPAESSRLLFIEETRVTNIMIEAASRMAHTKGVLALDEGLCLEAARWLGEMGLPLDAARALNRFADRNENSTLYAPASFDARLEAISILNSMRHRIHDALDRQIWWRELGSTFGSAMRQAVSGKDWRTLAELIESARLQLDDSDPTSLAEIPPFVAVRGESSLSKSSRYDVGTSPPTYSLEDAAAWVGGLGTHWWSSWAVDDHLYWAFVPPSGAVRGGVIDLQENGLAAALSNMSKHLPIRLQDEDPYDFELRMLESPFVSGPYESERAFSAALNALLPAPVLEVCNRQGRCSLALAPDPKLAAVPWAAIVLPRGEEDVRLIERASLFIAPPVSLIAALSLRPEPVGELPIALAVANPGGDLPQAEDVNSNLAAITKANPGAGTWTTAWLSRELQRIPFQSTVVFACHTGRRGSDPTGLGILLSPNTEQFQAEDSVEIVSAGDLIERSCDFPMPAQVVLLACDSANLGEAQAGEWLVLGPALLIAGAVRALLTSYPVVDTGAVDADLIKRLLDKKTLASALPDLQRDQIVRWRQGDFGAAPVHWAGHSLLGGFAESPLELRSRRSRHSRVERSVVQTINDATGLAHSRGRSEATWWDVACTLFTGGYMKEGTMQQVLSAALRKMSYRRATEKAGALIGKSGISQQVIEVLNRASGISARAGHPTIGIEHLVVAILQTEGPEATFFRLITGLDARLPEVTKVLLLEATTPGFRFTNLPELNNLPPEAVEEMYEALDALVPEPDEPRFVTGGWRSSLR